MGIQLKKSLARGAGLMTSLSVGVIALASHAAVDADVTSTTGAVVTAFKDNMISVISTNVPILVTLGVIMVGIGLVWKLGKRFVSGR